MEIVGAAEVICADKTGTVTEGRMTVRQVSTLSEEVDAQNITPGEQAEPVQTALLTAGLCNNAHRHPEHGYVGDPTETALLEFAERAGAPLERYQRTSEVPFTSERRMMSVTVSQPGEAGNLLLTKGAPEAVLPLCTSVRTAEGASPLTDEHRNALLEKAHALAGQALRVLAFAYKEQTTDAQASEEGLTFAALGAMSDPPRPEAAQAIAAAQRAGIRVVMITGDNSRTVAAIGGEVGVEGETVEAKELDELDEDGLRRAVNQTSIFARAEPRHKVLILRALKQDHEVVVMTGDGVNDAPALRNADVGIAMGIKGTDVARDTSDMVLLDDNFATIVSAVEEGRRIFRNIKKFVNYMLTGNLAEVLVILVATVFGYLSVTAVQILWINLVTDSGPAVALASDPSPRGAMREPPSPRRGAGALYGGPGRQCRRRQVPHTAGHVFHRASAVGSGDCADDDVHRLRGAGVPSVAGHTTTGGDADLHEQVAVGGGEREPAAASRHRLHAYREHGIRYGGAGPGTMERPPRGTGSGLRRSACHREGGRAAIRLAVGCCFTGDASPLSASYVRERGQPLESRRGLWYPQRLEAPFEAGRIFVKAQSWMKYVSKRISA